MHAITHDGFGDLGVLKVHEVPPPLLKPGQIRIAVKASGLNRADLLQRRGLYPPPAGESEIPGLEVSGVVSDHAPDITAWRKGDRVMALLAGGGYASEAAVDAGLCMRIPDKLSFAEAAAVPEAFLTAHHNLFHLGHAHEVKSALVHAGASGVGTAAIQLLRESKLTVFVTVGSADKAKACAAMGAIPILYKEKNFAEFIQNETKGVGVPLILDCVGASYLALNLAALAPDGKIVHIGTMGGAKGEIDLGQLLFKRASLIGSTLRPLSLERKRAVVKRFVGEFGISLQNGKLHAVVDSTFSFQEVAKAQEKMENNANTGKIVLLWD